MSNLNKFGITEAQMLVLANQNALQYRFGQDDMRDLLAYSQALLALAAPVASAAPIGELEVIKVGHGWEVRQDGRPLAYGNSQLDMQLIAAAWNQVASIANQLPKETLTDTEKLMRISDAQRQVDEWVEGLPYEPSLTEVKARLFDLITADTSPNKQLLEALKVTDAMVEAAENVGDLYRLGKPEIIRSAIRAALAAAGAKGEGE